MNAGCPVYIVDHDAISRRHLVTMLRRHDYRPTAFVGGKDFLDALSFLNSGIAILELRLPDISGLAVLEQIRHARLDILSIGTTACADIRTAVQAIKKGANDFLEKPFEDVALMAMIQEMVSLLNHKQSTTKLLNDANADKPKLSPREMEVIRALEYGGDNGAAADQLHLSVRTIESYRSRIMKKLGVRKFADAMMLAREDSLKKGVQ